MSTAIKITIGIGKPKLKFQRWESYNTIQCILSAKFLLQPSVVTHAPPLLFVLEPSPPPSAISLPYAPPTNSTMSPSTTPIGNSPSGATTLLLRLLFPFSFTLFHSSFHFSNEYQLVYKLESVQAITELIKFTIYKNLIPGLIIRHLQHSYIFLWNANSTIQLLNYVILF